MNNLYFDNASTTPLLPSVQELIKTNLDTFGNPSSLYELGQKSKELINDARKNVADFVGCLPKEIIFTSGGSESNTQAIFSTFDYAQKHGLGNHIITSQIEHHSILSACEYLAHYRGAEITYIGVDGEGRVNLKQLVESIGPNTYLITIMGANNEIGTLQDIHNIKRFADSNGIIFHSDCVQRFGHADINIDDVDMFSASGHKVGAMKGIGFLYVKNGTPLLPHIFGTQENALRGGTENLLGILSLGEASRMLAECMDKWNTHTAEVSEYIKNRILAEIPGVKLNGPDTGRLANNLNFSFDKIRGEELMFLLDMYGISVSTGSACNSSSGEPSHVLRAIGLGASQADSSIRISLSQFNTIAQAEYVVNKIKDSVEQLRSR